MKKFLASVLASLLLCTSSVQALDRVTWYAGQNPPSPWHNQVQRNTRIGFGQLVYDLMGSSGWFSNLKIAPVSGLLVNVGPASASTLGSLYQYLAEESSAWGGYPAGTGVLALGVDGTKVMLQGLTTGTSSIGPLTAPGTGGYSTDYLIECQVNTTDTGSTGATLVSAGGIISSVTVNETRADQVTCQSKAGTPAPTGTQTVPVVDAGWIAVGFVVVANGTVTITAGMITTYSYSSGVVLLSPLARQTGFINVSGNITTAANIGASGYINASTGTGVASVAGDLGASRSSTSGALILGGAGSSTQIDFGVTTAGYLTLGASTVVTSLSVLSLGGPAQVVAAGGDLEVKRNTTTGLIVLGGSSSSGTFDYGISFNNQFNLSKPLTVNGQLASTGLSTSSGTINTYTGQASTRGDLGVGQTTTGGEIIVGGNISNGTFDYGLTNSGVFAMNKSLYVGGIQSYATYGQSAALTAGDVNASRSTTAGNLTLGGSSSYGTLDYGVTVAGIISVNKPFNVPSGYLTVGPSGVSGTTGDLNVSRSTTTGAFFLGGASSNAQIDFNLANAGALTINKPLYATSFNGSGAGLTSGTVPNAALVTTPVTSVGATSPLSNTGSSTAPVIACGSCVLDNSYPLGTSVTNWGTGSTGNSGTASATITIPNAGSIWSVAVVALEMGNNATVTITQTGGNCSGSQVSTPGTANGTNSSSTLQGMFMCSTTTVNQNITFTLTNSYGGSGTQNVNYSVWRIVAIRTG